MTSFRRRLSGLSFFFFTAVLFCGLAVHATAGCNHQYEIVESHSATCTSTGGITYQCSECQDVLLIDTEEMLPHTWETVSRTNPTCTNSGTITRRCTVCAKEETQENGAATGHSFSPDTIHEPTCSEEGYTSRTCNHCGYEEKYEDSYLPKIDHTYERSVVTEPTCQSEGFAEYTCSVCAHNYRESIAIVDHDREATVTPPTHTEGGFTTYVCRFCNETKVDDYVDPLPYDLVYTILDEPTCTDSGIRLGECRDNCHHTVTEIIPATGHSFKDDEDGWAPVREATEALDGLEQRVCEYCGLTESRSIAYIAPEPEPVRTHSPALIICIAFVLILLLGVMVVVLLIILEHTGRKNHRKYALLTAVDRALAEQNSKQ